MSSTSGNTDHDLVDRRDAANVPRREVVRANLYLVVARAFSSPLQMEQTYPQQLREIVPRLPDGLQQAGRTLAAAWEDALKDRESLALAYARHFLGPFEILSSPYASHYLEPDQRLMGEVSQRVAQFYVAAGLGPGHGPNEAPDHVALEWEFMYYLTYRYVLTGEPRWIEQREEFRAVHLAHWMPTLAEVLTASAEHAFYQALAGLLTVLLQEESRQSESTR